MNVTGSCLCGAVRYELTQAPAWAHNCHCSRCRKTRGAAFSSNLFVGRDGFRFVEGEDQLQTYKPPGAERFTNVFCRQCGSNMPWLNESNGLMVVPMGSLDDNPGMTPLANIFVDSKASWFTITDELPRNPGPPGSG
jgi:hypothetical protein